MINRLLGVVYEQSDICQSETAVFSCSCRKAYFGGEDNDVGLDIEAVCANMNVFSSQNGDCLPFAALMTFSTVKPLPSLGKKP